MNVSKNLKNKKVVYLYANPPGEYAKYLTNLLLSIKKEISVSTAIYTKNNFSDIQFKSYSFLDKIQRILFKVKLSSYRSKDIKKFCEFDILHLQHSYLFHKVLDLFDFPKNKRPKVVITLRGGDTYVKPWIDKRWGDFYKNYGNKVDAFIAMSQHQKQYLQKWGVPSDKIHVIPISFGEKSKATSKFPNKKCIKIVSAYRMCWEKNIDGNLRVVKQLKEIGLSVKYDIFGDGPDTGQLLYLIDKYNLNEEVTYYGKIKNTTLKTQLVNYDFFLQLSLSDAFPTSVLEAQSKGVPCVVSNSGGLPEAIIHEENGYCVDSNDIDLAAQYIKELFQDSKKYQLFSKNAIEYVNNNFTLENETNKLISLYETI